MLIFRWVLHALSLILVAYLIPGITISGFYAALVVALVLGLINAVIRPVLVFLTLPISVLTLGLFTLVINAILFWFVSTVIKGFEVENFLAAFFGALVFSVLSSAINTLIKPHT